MKILVPTDFSPSADYTLKHIVRLMNQVNCTFSLLHTYEIPRFSKGEIVSINDQLKQAADEKLETLKREAALISENSNHIFHHQSLHGDFLRVVNRILKEDDIDLIAISGSKQSGSFKNEPAGKNYSKKIAEISTCPILIVPDQFGTSYRMQFSNNKAI